MSFFFVPIDTVLDIVEPIAKKSGFTPLTDQPRTGLTKDEDESRAKMGFKMTSVARKVYIDRNGDALMISRMDLSSVHPDAIKMPTITVQLTRPRLQSKTKAKAKDM